MSDAPRADEARYASDPFWAALDSLTTRLRYSPRVLFVKAPDSELGLNVAAINRLATEAGLGTVFEVESPGKVRLVRVLYPGNRKAPVSWTVWCGDWDNAPACMEDRAAAEAGRAKFTDTLDCLRGWQEVRAQ